MPGFQNEKKTNTQTILSGQYYLCTYGIQAVLNIWNWFWMAISWRKRKPNEQVNERGKSELHQPLLLKEKLCSSSAFLWNMLAIIILCLKGTQSQKLLGGTFISSMWMRFGEWIVRKKMTHLIISHLPTESLIISSNIWIWEGVHSVAH